MKLKCAKCAGDANGYICAICKVEAPEHDQKHTHGEPPSSRHHMPKCVACSEAEVHCKCSG